MTRGPKGSQGQRSRRERLIAAVLPSAGLFAALAFLMYGTGTMADMPGARVEFVREMDPGVYLLTDDGAFELFDWRMPLTELPSDAPTLHAEEVTSVLVVARHPEQAKACHLYRFEATAVVQWHKMQLDSQRLLLDPGPLPPGGYLLIVPTGDMFGGQTYYYFRLV